MAFLYLPLMAVAFFSVNNTKYGLVWKGFTLDWYIKLFQNELILQAAWNTLILAVVSTIVSTLLGTILAIGMDRFPWPRKMNTILDLILHLPVIIPDIIFAAAMVVAFGFFRALSSLFEPGLLNMIIAPYHLSDSFCGTCGQKPSGQYWQRCGRSGKGSLCRHHVSVVKVTLPLLMPGIVAGAMLAFTLSLDDFVISFFTAGPDSVTLPLYIFAAVRRVVTPQIHALSTLVLLVTIILVISMERFTRKINISKTVNRAGKLNY